MRIYNNISAMTAYRSMTKTDNVISKSMERLSTGLRINSAADDATGLVISEQMRSQISGFSQAIKNSQQGMSMLKTAEGAMGQQGELLGRIRDLILSSNSGNVTADNKATIQDEITQLVAQIDDIANNTQFNGNKLLDGTLGSEQFVKTASTALAVTGVSEISVNEGVATGTYKLHASGDYLMISGDGKRQAVLTSGGGVYKGTVNFDAFGISLDINMSTGSGIDVLSGKTILVSGSAGSGVDFQVGANYGQTLNVTINKMDSTSLGSGTFLADIDVSGGVFQDNLTAIDVAISQVSENRAALGSSINRFEANISNLTISRENLQASESLIRDLDMADEMVMLTRNQVLSQASTAMMAQANQKPQNILQLLR